MLTCIAADVDSGSDEDADAAAAFATSSLVVGLQHELSRAKPAAKLDLAAAAAACDAPLPLPLPLPASSLAEGLAASSLADRAPAPHTDLRSLPAVDRPLRWSEHWATLQKRPRERLGERRERRSLLLTAGGADEKRAPERDEPETRLVSHERMPHVEHPHRELRSSNLTEYADRVDFIAPAENMKAIFKLLHEEGGMSIAVHRVGNSLVLEGLEADAPARGGGGGGGGGDGGGGDGTALSEAIDGALQLRRKSLDERFITYLLGRDGATTDAAGAGGVGGEATADVGALGDSADKIAEIEAEIEAEIAGESAEEWMPPREPPAGFRRVLRWQASRHLP